MERGYDDLPGRRARARLDGMVATCAVDAQQDERESGSTLPRRRDLPEEGHINYPPACSHRAYNTLRGSDGIIYGCLRRGVRGYQQYYQKYMSGGYQKYYKQ